MENNGMNQLISKRLDEIHEDLSDLRGSLRESLKEVSLAVNKLVALESSQTAMNKTFDRLERQFEAERLERKELERRIDALEKDVPMQKQIVRWITSAVWGAVILVAGYVAKFAGLL